MKWSLSWTILALLPVAAYGASQYVGSEACKTCHADVYSTFYRNPHFRPSAEEKAAGSGGCESCHGPGSAHIQAHGGKSTIIAFSELSAERTLDACLRCHSETISRANIRRSEHTLNGMACTSCHSIHRAKTAARLLAKPQRELCYGCHADVRAQFSLPFKHRVNEGFMTCTDCHNPHGAFHPTWNVAARPRMVEQALANEEPCLKCHAEKRGPFVYEHAAVRVDGCETCHMPHGSPNSRLLRRPVVFTMCLECHNGAGNFGREGKSEPLTDPDPKHIFHNMADPRFQNCTACHVRIHGSNSDPTFLR
jgi:DmsE family decaheme c-type cytochrome